MKLTINPAKNLQGEVTPPGSKSHTVRAMFMATMAKGTSYLQNALDAEDGHAVIEVCKGLGAKIDSKKNGKGGLDVTIKSEGVRLNTLETDLFSANSGITTTITIPLIGLRKNTNIPLTLASGEQMQKRPLASIIKAVKDLGMNVVAFDDNDSCPLGLSGNLEGGSAEVEGKNSQYLSALLLTLPCATKDSTITVKNLEERPYVDLTLSWLDEQNIRYEHQEKNGIDTYKIFGNQHYHSFNKTVPGDFSTAAAFIIAAVLLPGEVIIHGMNMKDPQGDKQIIPILQDMGAAIEIQKTVQEDTIKIHGGKLLKGTTIDCKDIPDLVPVLAVIASQASGKTSLIGVENSRIKETDRVKSMATELPKMGVKIQQAKNSLTVFQSKLQGAKVQGYTDHRTIMALAIAGLLADGKTEIDTAEGVNKTCPTFVDMMNALGVKMTLKA